MERRARELGGDPKDPSSWTPEILRAPLFPNKAGGVCSKSKVVDGWKKITPEGGEAPGGHTPRRSGAKRRARRGWSLEIIMILGRWASSAIMAYVEEALAELAIRGDGPRKPGQVKNTEPSDEWESALEPLERRIAKAEEKIRKLVKSKQARVHPGGRSSPSHHDGPEGKEMAQEHSPERKDPP